MASADRGTRYGRGLMMYAVAGVPSGGVAGGLIAIIDAVVTRWSALRVLWDAGDTTSVFQWLFADFAQYALFGAFFGTFLGAMTHMICRNWSREWRAYGLVVLWAVLLGSFLLVMSLAFSPQSGALVVAVGFGIGACFGAFLGLFVRIATWFSDRFLAHMAKTPKETKKC